MFGRKKWEATSRGWLKEVLVLWFFGSLVRGLELPLGLV